MAYRLSLTSCKSDTACACSSQAVQQAQQVQQAEEREPHEPVDLSAYGSPEELEAAVGGDRLKAELQVRLPVRRPPGQLRAARCTCLGRAVWWLVAVPADAA